MKLDEFIKSMSSLLEKNAFMGRSQNLQNSLSLLTETLAKGERELPANQMSSQVTAGWWAANQMAATGNDQDMIDVSKAWDILYESCGNLTNSTYKQHFREKLEKEFAKTPEAYSEEFKTLWRTVFTDKDGPKESPLAELSGFIDEFKPIKAEAAAVASAQEKQEFFELPKMKDNNVHGVTSLGSGQYSIFGKNDSGQDRKITVDFVKQEIMKFDGTKVRFDQAHDRSLLGPMERGMFFHRDKILPHFGHSMEEPIASKTAVFRASLLELKGIPKPLTQLANFPGCEINGAVNLSASLFKIQGKNHKGESRELTINFEEQKVYTHDNRCISFDDISSRRTNLGPMEQYMFANKAAILSHFNFEPPDKGVAAAASMKL